MSKLARALLLPGVSALTLALCVFALSAIAQEPAKTPIDELNSYMDEDYIGGLNREGVSLATRIAKQIDAELPGTSRLCSEPDPMAGTLIGSVSEKQSDPKEFLASLSPALQAWASIVRERSPAQKAIAVYAMGLVGTKANEFSQLIWTSYKDGAWAAESAGRLGCQNMASGGLRALQPRPLFPDHDESLQCGASRRSWLLNHTLDPTTRWPPKFIGDAWNEISETCRSDQDRIAIPDDAAFVLDAMLNDRSMEPEFQSAWLNVLAYNTKVPASLTETLQLLSSAPDPALAWAAQRALVATGTQQGAQQFARWLSEEHVFNWAWRDVGTSMRPHIEIVLPALADALRSETWSDRTAAVEVLGDLQSPETILLLESAISSLDWPTTQAVATALAPLASENEEARRILAQLESSYWSGRVRTVAKLAQETGLGIHGDPFECGFTPQQVQKSEQQQLHPESDDGMSTICFSNCMDCFADHRLSCNDQGRARGRYRDANNQSLAIKWGKPSRERLPRVKAGDVSGWCSKYGTTTSLKVEDGWLVGCEGFESEGMLSFVPRKGPAELVEIHHMGATAIIPVGGRIFVAGSAPFEFAGAGLFELHRDTDGKWTAESVANLPAAVNAYSVVGDRIAFRDDNNVVIFDPKGEISALNCEAE